MIRFKFWEPVYFQNCTDKVGKFLMHPRMFVGFTCNFGGPTTFKMLQCNTNLHKRNMVVHRGTVVPHNLVAKGYNSSLEPKSDAYFPKVHL